MSKDLKKVETMDKYQKSMYKDLAKGAKKYDITRSPQYQQALQKIQGLSGYYQNLMSQTPQGYEQFKAPMMSEFQQQTVPFIAEKFAGMGAQSSSAFNQSMGAAGRTLEERLAALRTGLQTQGAQGLQSLIAPQMGAAMSPYEMLMNRSQMVMGASPFSYFQPAAKQPGAMGQFFGGMSGGIGQGIGTGIGSLIGSYFGGPIGGAAGGGIGGAFSSLFG